MFGFAAGIHIGGSWANDYWADHSTDKEFGGSAVYHLGRFYYVVPEHEFNAMLAASERPRSA